MASGAGDILKYGLIGLAGYWVYSKLFAGPGGLTLGNLSAALSPSAAPAAAPPAPPPAYQYQPPTLAQQLQSAAGANQTLLAADQWRYYYSRLPGHSDTSIDDASYAALFFPNGPAPSLAAEPTMTASAFVSALASKGFSGVGHGRVTRVIPVPGARRSVRAGYVLASTPMTRSINYVRRVS